MLRRYIKQKLSDNQRVAVEKLVRRVWWLLDMLLFPYQLIVTIYVKRKCPVNTLSPMQTIEAIKEGTSVSRFGDGELNLLLHKRGIVFQEWDEELSNQLREILTMNTNSLTSENGGFMVGIPFIITTYRGYRYSVRFLLYWVKYNFYNLRNIQLLLRSRIYLDALFARSLNMRDRVKIYEAICDIWSGKHLVIIEGETVKFGVNKSILSNAKSIARIICPVKNAYSEYDEILEAAIKCDKDSLILIILGPTATILAYDLYKLGYRAVDFGQGNFSKDIKETGNILTELDYHQQIIARIGVTDNALLISNSRISNHNTRSLQNEAYSR